MATTRFNSQIVPKDATAQYGYLYFSFPSDLAVEATGATSTGTAMEVIGAVGITPELRNATLPGIVFNTTATQSVYTKSMLVPNDLDSSQTVYVAPVYSSGVAAASTTATSICTVLMNSWTSNELITSVTSAFLVTATAFTISPTTTADHMQIGTNAALSASPNPGEIMALKILMDSEHTTEAISPMLHGVKFTYFRRFV